MKESTCCTRIVNSLKAEGFFAFKIPDMPRTAGTKFNRKKGFDIIAARNFYPMFIEVKLVKSLPKTIDAFRKLFTEGQLEIFDDVTKKRQAECLAFIVLFKNSLTGPRVNELYIFEWRFVVEGNVEHVWGPIKFEKGLYKLQAFTNFYESGLAN